MNIFKKILIALNLVLSFALTFSNQALIGKYLFVIGTEGVKVIDVSDGFNPLIVGNIKLQDVQGITFGNKYLYVANGTNGLLVYDVSNPLQPVLNSSLRTGGYVLRAVFEKNHLFTVDRDKGLMVFDISIPDEPVLVYRNSFKSKVSDIFIDGKRGFVAVNGDGIYVLDLSDLENPSQIAKIDVLSDIYSIFVSKNYLYVTVGDKGMLIFDVSSPAKFKSVATFDTDGTAYDVYVYGNYAFVADGSNGIVVVDVRNPAFPTKFSVLKTDSPAVRVDVYEKYLYNFEKDKVLVVDMTSPSNFVKAEQVSKGISLNPPTGLSAAVVIGNVVNLKWVDNSNNEEGFKIERREENGNWIMIATVGKDVTEYVDKQVSATKYFYRVKAFSKDAESNYSNQVSVTISATVPKVSIQATSSKSVVLNWNIDFIKNAKEVVVYRKAEGENWKDVVALSNTSDGYIDDKVLPEMIYYYKVVVKTNDGQEQEIANFDVKTLNAPSNVWVTPVSPMQLKVQWWDNSNFESGYVIERKSDKAWEAIFTTKENVREYVDTVVPEVLYTYRIRAYNSYGYSSYSEEVSGNTLNPPTNLTAEATGSSVLLIWIDNSQREEKVEVYRRVGRTLQKLGTLPANSTRYIDETTEFDKTYSYYVRYYNGENFVDSTVITITVLPAPSKLKVTAISSTSVQVSWVDNSTQEKAYVVERKDGTSGKWKEVASLSPNSEMYKDTELVPGFTYFYRVKCVSNYGDQVYSEEVKITMPKN